MFSWLDSMDLYIQPSLVEAMPRALIEAMSRGLPAFASRIGAMPELVGDACIFDRKDVAAIVNYIDGIDADSAKTMAKSNFEYAKQFQKALLEKKRYDFYADFAEKNEECTKCL